MPSIQASSPEPTIKIPSIGVDAPVIYDEVRTEDNAVQKALERGVLHFGKSALPGEVGNAIFVGHSSNLPWVPGNYKFVFALLDKVQIGQDIVLEYNGTRYTYRINDSKIVSPENIAVLEDSTTSKLTLITCTPVGSNSQRLVVSAELIAPKLEDLTYQGHMIFSEPSSKLPGNTTPKNSVIRQAFSWVGDKLTSPESRNLVSTTFCIAPSTIRTAMSAQYNHLNVSFYENSQDYPSQHVDEREGGQWVPALSSYCYEQSN